MRKQNKIEIRFLGGFTLAEVLITLMIIGVVAALTIPALLKTTEKLELKTAFKKEYAMLLNAINLVQVENGGSQYKCYSGGPYTDCATFWTAMKNKMKAINCVDDGSYKCYPNYADEITGVYSRYGGLNTMHGYTPKTIMVIADGAFLIPNAYDFNETGSAFAPEWFFLDINGIKGPNKWGYDVYVLILENKNGTTKIGTWYYILEDANAMWGNSILQGK